MQSPEQSYQFPKRETISGEKGVKAPRTGQNLSGAVGGNLSIKVNNPMNAASTALIRCACFGAAPVFPRNLVTVKGRHFRRPLCAEIDPDELRETKARLAPAAVGHEAHPHEAQDHHRPGGGFRNGGHTCYCTRFSSESRVETSGGSNTEV